MNRKSFRESLRNGLPKLNRVQSIGSLIKTPKAELKSTERHSIGTFTPNQSGSEKLEMYEQLINELKKDLWDSVNKQKELKIENESLKEKCQKSGFDFKSPLKEINSTVKEQSSDMQENEFFNDLQRENQLLRKKVLEMEGIIRANNCKYSQEEKNDVSNYTKKIENLEKEVAFSDAEQKTFKQAINLLENQKKKFVNTIKDLELEVITLKQTVQVDNSEEIKAYKVKIQKIKEKAELALDCKNRKIDKKNKKISSLVQKNLELQENCKNLESTLQTAENAKFLEKVKTDLETIYLNRVNIKETPSKTDIKNPPHRSNSNTDKIHTKQRSFNPSFLTSTPETVKSQFPTPHISSKSFLLSTFSFPTHTRSISDIPS